MLNATPTRLTQLATIGRALTLRAAERRHARAVAEANYAERSYSHEVRQADDALVAMRRACAIPVPPAQPPRPARRSLVMERTAAANNLTRARVVYGWGSPEAAAAQAELEAVEAALQAAPSPHVAAARAKKVARLLGELLLVQIDRGQHLEPEQLARALEALDSRWWAGLARRAGVPVPSDTTKALVIAAARRGQGGTVAA